ncbi:unnamed protein product [Dicrocoelium dendriticum]|nr:unnamed protein product [Dicrocoelium dendriticum]
MGSVFSTYLQMMNELRIRVSKTAAACEKLKHKVWNNHQLTITTKLMVYKSMVLSILLQGCETWRRLYRKAVRNLE